MTGSGAHLLVFFDGLVGVESSPCQRFRGCFVTLKTPGGNLKCRVSPLRSWGKKPEGTRRHRWVFFMRNWFHPTEWVQKPDTDRVPPPTKKTDYPEVLLTHTSASKWWIQKNNLTNPKYQVICSRRAPDPVINRG